MRLGSSKGSNRLPEGWIEGKDICTQSGLIRYLGIFLGAPEQIAKKLKQRTSDRIQKRQQRGEKKECRPQEQEEEQH
jgi:hypothetical protein